LVIGALPAGAAPTSSSTPTATPPLPPASPLAVHTRVSRATPRLGEPVDYEIEIRHAAEESYAPAGEPALDPFEAEPLGCRRAAAPGAGEVLTACAWRLRLFELGAHDVPAVRFQASGPGGPRSLAVPGPRVETAGLIDPSAPAGSLQLRPPAPPVPLLVRSWRLVLWAAGALLALAAAVLAWRAWRRRGRRVAEPPPPLPPGERLARRLDALDAERLPEQGRGREFFFRLSEAVREYLSGVTRVNALDLTTGELLDALAAEGDPRVDLAALRAFCERADLVKFARFPAGGRECEAGMRYARSLLEGTAPGVTSARASTGSARAGFILMALTIYRSP
jgi:hypothetical protein